MVKYLKVKILIGLNKILIVVHTKGVILLLFIFRLLIF